MTPEARDAADPDREAQRPVHSPRDVFLARPVVAMALLAALAGAAELVPGLEPIRVLSARKPASDSAPAAAAVSEPAVGEAEISTETRGRAELAPGALDRAAAPLALPSPSALLDKPPIVPIVDPSGTALNAFFRALELTRQKQPRAITRITHFGDSIVASDYVSGALRRRFQERFGDAGHGFTLIANAWPAYAHNDIERYATAGWKVSRVVGPLSEDGFYGLGCVSFVAEKNVLARFGTSKKGDFGARASRFLVSYLAAPNGGTFEISVDGKPHALVDTEAPSKRSSVYEVTVPDGPHEFSLLTKSKSSRLFGVILERDEPGVVLDAIGIQGARIRFLDKQDDAHWAEQLRLRNPNLLIYEFGANESADGVLYPMVDYHRTMKEVVAQGQRALPDASCLIIGAMDRATKSGEEIKSVRVIPLLIAEQRAVAAALGCAFFDTYQAMGGEGSMARWVRRGLGHADMTHPTSIGSDMIGTYIYRALMQRYGEFLTEGAGKTSPKAAPATSSPSLQ